MNRHTVLCSLFFSISLSFSFSLFPLDLYLLYAKLEEDYGLTRRAMSVYERATEAVLPEEQYDVCHVTITLLSCDFIFYRCSVYTSSMRLRCFEQSENIKYFTVFHYYSSLSSLLSDATCMDGLFSILNRTEQDY